MKKVFVIVEDYRNEKCGDSIEQIEVIAVCKSKKTAQDKVEELHKQAISLAKRIFDEDSLETSIGEYGSSCYLNYEWDTFHCDYTIKECEII